MAIHVDDTIVSIVNLQVFVRMVANIVNSYRTGGQQDNKWVHLLSDMIFIQQ